MNNILRNKIYSYCVKNKVSQAKFAEMCGMNKASLYKFMQSTRKLNEENAKAITLVLGAVKGK